MSNYLELFGRPQQGVDSCADGMEVFVNSLKQVLRRPNLGYANGVNYRTKNLALNKWERKKYKVKERGVTPLLKGITKDEERGFGKCYAKQGRI